MYLDQLHALSDAQAVTATAPSTNVIDTGVAGRAVGDGEPLELVCSVHTTTASGGATTMTVALQDSADNSSFADVLVSPSIAKAALVAGYEFFRTRLPTGLRRYLRLNYTVGTADFTAGAFSAFIVKDRHASTAQASGYTVS